MGGIKFPFDRMAYLEGIVNKATAGPWVCFEHERKENITMANATGQLVGYIGKGTPANNLDFIMLMNPELAKEMLTEIKVLYHQLLALRVHYENLLKIKT